MALNNPAFSRSAAFNGQGAVAVAQNVSASQLDEIYNRPSAPAEGEVPGTLPDGDIQRRCHLDGEQGPRGGGGRCGICG